MKKGNSKRLFARINSSRNERFAFSRLEVKGWESRRWRSSVFLTLREKFTPRRRRKSSVSAHGSQEGLPAGQKFRGRHPRSRQFVFLQRRRLLSGEQPRKRAESSTIPACGPANYLIIYLPSSFRRIIPPPTASFILYRGPISMQPAAYCPATWPTNCLLSGPLLPDLFALISGPTVLNNFRRV